MKNDIPLLETEVKPFAQRSTELEQVTAAESEQESEQESEHKGAVLADLHRLA